MGASFHVGLEEAVKSLEENVTDHEKSIGDLYEHIGSINRFLTEQFPEQLVPHYTTKNWVRAQDEKFKKEEQVRAAIDLIKKAGYLVSLEPVKHKI